MKKIIILILIPLSVRLFAAAPFYNKNDSVVLRRLLIAQSLPENTIEFYKCDNPLCPQKHFKVVPTAKVAAAKTAQKTGQ